MTSQTPIRWFASIRSQWSQLGRGYRRFMSDQEESSTYLREAGLKPVVKKLLGNCSSERVLDVGAGGAWLFKEVRPRQAVAVDLAPAAHYPPGVEYRQGDAAALEFSDDYFDTVVSNLMLCYCRDLNSPLAEMARVTRPGGRLLVSTVHPHFYRTGEGNPDGSFTIASDLRRKHAKSIMIGGKVGPFRYFYHPYPDYLNAIIRAGLNIAHVEDWFFDEEDYRGRFRADTILRSARVPVFSFFVCTKPANYSTSS